MANLGRVLLVDDDAVSNFIVEQQLSSADMAGQVTVVENGQDALALVSKGSFDFILLDMHMPLMDGFEFLEALKSLQESTGIAVPDVVMLTSSLSKFDRARAEQYPIKGYLTKPLEIAHLENLGELIAEA